MMAWLGAAFLVAAAMALIVVFRLPAINRDVMAAAGRALSVVGSAALSDREKERALRRCAVRLFGLLGRLAIGGAAAVLLPFGLLWGLDRAEWIDLTAVLRTATSPLFLLAGAAAGLVALRALRSSPGEAEPVYSPGDQLVHRLAFSTSGIQRAVARLEDRLLASRLAACDDRRPVFITALPRAGTTLLLECCARVPELASHCYRDMPFLLCPVAWSACARAFRRRSQARERAHGDGMRIDFDSPEALEEMVWKAFWPRHYAGDRVVPWTREMRDQRFEAFLRSHMRKIVRLRRGRDAAAARYVSKNNLNIARLELLEALFPEGVIVVPFREPLQHAASLLRQHRNFLAIHARDPFAAEYMREIGHFEFGENLRPVDFDGWGDHPAADPLTLAFWLEYWVVTYGHLLQRRAGRVRLVDYDALAARPAERLIELGEVIGLRDPAALLAAAPPIAPQRGHAVDTSGVPSSLLARVDAVYAALRSAMRPEEASARRA